jgi:beta-phosphoglucomutase
MKVKFCQEFFTISERKQPTHCLVQLAECPTYSRKTGLLSYFDAVVDGNDVTNAKPDRKFS